MQVQSLLVLGDGLRVLAGHAVSQTQIKVRAVIGGIGRDGLGERLHRRAGFSGVQRLEPVRDVIGGLGEQSD